MISPLDRIPAQGKSGRKKITYSDNTVEYVKVESADDAIETGTPLNRATLLAMQGFIGNRTTFSGDTVTETNSRGDVLTTTFSGNTVTETFVGVGGETVTKTTTFDTTITEVIT